MAASSATSSLILPFSSSSSSSLLSKTLISVRPKTLLLVSSSSSSSSSSVSLSLRTPLSPYPVLHNARSLRSAFVRKVAVSSDVEQEEEEEEEEEQEEEVSFSPDLKLFVGNLPFTVDSAELAGLFERAGNVEMVEVIYDKVTGRSRGFGFVTMSTVKEVEAAARQFNGYTTLNRRTLSEKVIRWTLLITKVHQKGVCWEPSHEDQMWAQELGGRALRVNAGPPPPKDDFPSRGGFRSGGSSGGSFGGSSGGSFDSANRVYVGNLSWGVDDLALETLFSEKGRVLDAKVVYDRESGRSRGFGFVTYSSSAEVETAVSSLNGADLDGRSIRVTVAESRPRRQF